MLSSLVYVKCDTFFYKKCGQASAVDEVSNIYTKPDKVELKKNMDNRVITIANDIDEKAVRRIEEINEQDYSIFIETLKKFCSAQGVK
jgi:hypothetical protein